MTWLPSFSLAASAMASFFVGLGKVDDILAAARQVAYATSDPSSKSIGYVTHAPAETCVSHGTLSGIHMWRLVSEYPLQQLVSRQTAREAVCRRDRS
jgi:hypothetical protein